MEPVTCSISLICIVHSTILNPEHSTNHKHDLNNTNSNIKFHHLVSLDECSVLV